MKNPKRYRLRHNLFWITLLICVWLFCSAQVQAAGTSIGRLAERVATFPDWEHKPGVLPAAGDLVYPSWMEGNWQMRSTLVAMVAPLAPDIVTPGFEGNRQFLDQPVMARIRFVSALVGKGQFLNRVLKIDQQVVSDRAFNGLSLARAYLGDDGVQSVKVDPENPNRQITFLKDNRQLVSTVTGRAVESPDDPDFITTELFQQFFMGAGDAAVYLNEVENTTAYHLRTEDLEETDEPMVMADQITAIYLSPQDPDYFKAANQPVALYKYRLEFRRL